MRCILDASVAMRWATPEEEMPPLAQRVRAGALKKELDLWVPALWHWEMANGLVLMERRSTISAEMAKLAWEQMENWAAKVTTEVGPQAPVHAAYQLARRYRLTAYDAAYLELAVRMNALLATLDRGLAEAARSAGVELL